MKRTPTLIILIVFALSISSTTDNGYKFIKSIAFTQPVHLTTDHLGNAYVLVENQILQFDTIGRPKSNFSQNSLGVIRTIDASNPMKLLLFYSDFAKTIILDSKLSIQTIIDFRTLQINQPLAVCTSEENGYWVYDQEDDLLKKLDMNLQVITRSGSITQITGYQIQPGIMIESDGFIYMNNPSTGIIIFDRYGEYYKTLPYKGLSTFQVIGRDIIFTINDKLLRIDMRTSEEKEVILPVKSSVISARIEQHKLYLLTTDSLRFYSF